MLDIDLVVPPTGTPLDGPLAQLLELVNGTVAPTLDQVIDLLQQNGGAIEIPGLGKLELGYSRTGVGARQAVAVALSLRVTLYGLDGVAGGADDSTLKIGRSFAKIIGNMPHAVMGGSGWAADADLVGGTAHIGDIVPEAAALPGHRRPDPDQGARLGQHPRREHRRPPGQRQRPDHPDRPGPRLDRGLGRPRRARLRRHRR